MILEEAAEEKRVVVGVWGVQPTPAPPSTHKSITALVVGGEGGA
jgi:hypothetical protein